MWVIKMQSKKNPAGIVASPVMETQSGADKMLELLQGQARSAEDYAENPRHYFVAQHIPRRRKK